MTQASLAQALLEGGFPLPGGLIDPFGRTAERRFNVYRNNVAVGLTAALEDGFPIVRKIVGPEFFAAMAGVFLRAHPPTSPILLRYGSEFPTFLTGFAPVKELAYLPAVARLEYALRESYHSADAPPVSMKDLAALGLENLLTKRVRLAPSLRFLSSNWPVFSIWQANVHDTPLRSTEAETVLVLRPDFDPYPVLLPKSGAEMVQAILEGRPIGQALALGSNVAASALLSILLQGQAITEFVE